jgi:biotin-dependent carboxylase-like uncharacterized protein
VTALRVIRAGISSTFQDAGRFGYRAYGVPASGALDATALALANALVGNEANEAALEMLYSGVALRVEGGSVRVAVAGADADAEVERSGGTARQTLGGWQTATLNEGDTLRIGTITRSAAAYLAVEGGYDVPHVLGSASTYARAGLGGFEGRALKARDVVHTRLAHPSARAESRYSRPPQLSTPRELRVMSGPQADRFDADSLRRLSAAPYTVSTNSDRSGLRLEGEILQHVGGFDLTSEGVAPGSIQVPGSGLPVILIGDHPTVGGYPKIATIVSADVPAAGRLRIGARVSFRVVDEDEARKAREIAKREIEDTIASLCDAK